MYSAHSYFKKNRVVLFCIVTFQFLIIVSCTTNISNKCNLKIINQGKSEFVSKTEDIVGYQLFFRIEATNNCDLTKNDRAVKELFRKYAEENGYNEYEILRDDMDKRYNVRRYVVRFK